MLYYMFNKPKGCVTACSDAEHHTVMEYFPPELAARLHPVGRLDEDTCGLLIMTDDGSIDQRLLSPENHVSKTYYFHAFGDITEEKIKELEGGICLGSMTALPAVFEMQQRCHVRDIEQYMPPSRRERYMKNPDGKAFTARLTVYEGKKHQVKRMLRAVGCKICYLRRERIGALSLDPLLPPGGYRVLTDEELDLLLTGRSQR